MVLNRKKSENMASITRKPAHTHKNIISASNMFVNDKITVNAPHCFACVVVVVFINSGNNSNRCLKIKLVTSRASANSMFVDRCLAFKNNIVSDYNIDSPSAHSHTHTSTNQTNCTI